MSAFLLTPRAEKDLDELFLYIARDDFDTAIRYLEKIEGKCRLLAQSPNMGRSRSDRGKGVVSFPVDDYLIYYRKQTVLIEILRTIHTARQQPLNFDDSEE